MALQQELGLKKAIRVLEHEAILNIYYTASQVKKLADGFFRQFGLTDVQFNVMMLLHYHASPKQGLTQAQLSDMMLVNRANITSLIDRMEKAELVCRTTLNSDRRFNIVKLTARGKKLFAKVEPLYAKLIKDLMTPAKESEQRELIEILEKIRGKMNK